MEIALFEPEIPPNTGNIARLCVNAGVPLHIIGEPAFDLSEKAVRRAGLDYWDDLILFRHEDWNNFFTGKNGKWAKGFFSFKIWKDCLLRGRIPDRGRICFRTGDERSS